MQLNSKSRLFQSYSERISKQKENSVVNSRLLSYFSLLSSENYTREYMFLFDFLDDTEFIKLRDLCRFNCDKNLYDKFARKVPNSKLFELESGSPEYYQAIDSVFYEISYFNNELAKSYRNHLLGDINDDNAFLHPIGSYSRTRSFQKHGFLTLLQNLLKNRVSYNQSANALIYKPKGSKIPKVLQLREIDDQSDSVPTFNDIVLALSHMMLPILEPKDAFEALTEFFTPDASEISEIIQFKDCYLMHGKLHEGVAQIEGVPKAFINRSVYDSFSTKTLTGDFQPIKNLLLHLVDYDEASYARIFSTISVMFLNSPKFKKQFNSIPQFYGPSGENGKSVFVELLINAVGRSNVCSFKLSDLSNDKTLSSIASALLAIDQDAAATHINDTTAGVFKKITSGEAVDIKQLYVQSSVSTSILTMLMTASNTLPSSSDKSEAYIRRLDIVRSSNKLLNAPFLKGKSPEEINSWFKYIYSDEAAQTLLEMLVIESQKLYHDNVRPPRSQAMEELVSGFNEDNNSAEAFIEAVGLEQILGYSAKSVKEHYEQWCIDNDMTLLKSKFKKFLEEKYGIKLRQSRRFVNLNDYHNLQTALIKGQPVRTYAPINEDDYERSMQSLEEINDLLFLDKPSEFEVLKTHWKGESNE